MSSLIRRAITMGAAKAAVVIAAAEAGLRIMEYSPKSVKLSVCRARGRSKNELAFMVRALLELRKRRNPMPPTLWRSASPTSFLRIL